MLKRASIVLLVFVLLCTMNPGIMPDAQAASSSTYYIEVDIANQITTVYRTSDKSVVRQMICSTGTGNRTPRGTFKLAKSRKSTDRKSWYYISKYRCYVKYATRISGPYLFHSLPYNSKSMSNIDRTALKKMGSKASHGCIRLYWEDSKWIAQNCPDGTKVRIYSNGSSKSSLKRLLANEGYSATSGLTYAQFIAKDYKTKVDGTMGRGTSGDEVKAMQSRLISLGFMTGSASGQYNNATIAAVLRYQTAIGVEATGLASAELVDLIMSSDHVLGSYTTLSVNMSGPVVKSLQESLHAIGFYDGEIDGNYTAAFAQAVSKFCICTGRAASNLASPAIQNAADALLKDLNERFGEGNFDMLLTSSSTRYGTVTKSYARLYKTASASSSRLYKISRNKKVTVLSKGSKWSKVKYGSKTGYVYTSSLKFTNTVRYTAYWGVRSDHARQADLSSINWGDGVVELQERLRALGFFSSSNSQLYDTATINAVMAYQDAAGLDPTGAASVALQNDIFTRDDITGTRTRLSAGMDNPAVAAMQQALFALQYYDGECNGLYDAATTQAVHLFTKVNGLGETSTASTTVQNTIRKQHLDCEAIYGSGNYALSISSTKTKMVSSTSSQKLYQKASSGSKSLASVAKGKTAALLNKGSKWTKVRYGSKVGYLRTKYLKFYTHVDWFVEFNAPEVPDASLLIYGDEVDTPIESDAVAPTEDPNYVGLIPDTGDAAPEIEDTSIKPEMPNAGDSSNATDISPTTDVPAEMDVPAEVDVPIGADVPPEVGVSPAA